MLIALFRVSQILHPRNQQQKGPVIYEYNSQQVLTSVSRSLVKDFLHPADSLFEVFLNHHNSYRYALFKPQVGSKMKAEKRKMGV